ncbi:MAG: hypothetical protein HY925_00395, partial [Elusimicrobia bacterium]|nr:hypothetical protein [Elusimicrobiota bacterium]
MTSRRPALSPFLQYALLWAAAFAGCTLALSGDFALDDATYILRNPALASPREWPRFFYDPFSVVANPTMALHAYRPFTGLIYGLTTLVFGYSPFWFHVVSAALHATNVCLVWT